jgi:hypothetical protein
LASGAKVRAFGPPLRAWPPDRSRPASIRCRPKALSRLRELNRLDGCG